MPKNVDTSGTDFPSKLRELRETALLTREQLAHKAGLDYRTVLDIEEGRRPRVTEQTLNLISTALGVTRKELLRTPADEEQAQHQTLDGTQSLPYKSRSRRQVAIASISLVLAALAVLTARHYLLSRAKYSVDGSTIKAAAPILGTLWVREHDSTILSDLYGPWDGAQTVAYGLDAEGKDGGTLFVCGLVSGKELWQAEPDLAEIAEVFGSELAARGAYRCLAIGFVDFDGNGEDELFTYYGHHRWGRAFISLYQRDGKRIGTYYNWGLLYDVLAEDIDRDGKEELLLAGTNNAPAYEGATLVILDEDHIHGASVDSFVNPNCTLRDSSLIRIILPRFDDMFMENLGIVRLVARDLVVDRKTDGQLVITCSVGSEKAPHVLTLDEYLNPVSIWPSDPLSIETRKWPEDQRERFLSAEYTKEWLSRGYRYGSLARTVREEGPYP